MATISAPFSVRYNPQAFQEKPYTRFKRDPKRFLANYLYSSRPEVAPAPTHTGEVTVVCISDTHNATPDIPPGDILLHAGDLTEHGGFVEIQKQLDWINSLPHAYKIVVAGNHDLLLDTVFSDQFPYRIVGSPEHDSSTTHADLNWGNIIYLQDSSTTVTTPDGRTITIYGSPMTPQFGTSAFQYPRIRNVWKDKIPSHTDILLTHGPPKGHLDEGGKGCEWLTRELWSKRPSLVVFGHIHEGRGMERLRWDYLQKAYDGVNIGDKGWLSIIIMVTVLGFQKLLSRLFGRKEIASATLVNAAAAADLNFPRGKPGMVVKM